MGSSEEVAERVIQQINERCCIEISIAHHLTGKEGLPGATAKQASHHPVAHVHVMSYFLKQRTRLRLSSFDKYLLNTGYVCHSLYNIRNHLKFIFEVFSQIPFGYLNTSLDGANVGALIAAAVKVPGDKKNPVKISRKDVSYI